MTEQFVADMKLALQGVRNCTYDAEIALDGGDMKVASTELYKMLGNAIACAVGFTARGIYEVTKAENDQD